MPQFGLLAAIGRDPDRTLSAIADAIVVDETTLTRNLAILSRRGLVECTGGRGRTGKKIRLTEAGESLLVRCMEQWRAGHAMLTRGMTPEECAAGLAFMQGLERAADAARSAGPVWEP
ncbi:MAG: MarR family winged helix-turn-helix transcriptional regulator [Hyphomonadaceae bacterium]